MYVSFTSLALIHYVCTRSSSSVATVTAASTPTAASAPPPATTEVAVDSMGIAGKQVKLATPTVAGSGAAAPAEDFFEERCVFQSRRAWGAILIPLPTHCVITGC